MSSSSSALQQPETTTSNFKNNNNNNNDNNNNNKKRKQEEKEGVEEEEDGVVTTTPHHSAKKLLKTTTENGEAIALKPLNSFSVPLLTDMYEVTMAYGYWFHGKHEQHGVFDLFFRTCPFRGEFAIFAGLEECIRFLSDYKFTKEHIDYLKRVMPGRDEKFWDWLSSVDCSKIRIYAHPEGSMCFPKVPLLRVEGPVAVAQLLEAPLLNLINYASLVATNAARYRVAAGPNNTLLEFGLRRAQGPDGAISASRYSIMGGFDGTSNVLAGMLFGLVPKGTLAHSFITSFSSSDRQELSQKRIRLGPHHGHADANGRGEMSELPFLQIVEECRAKVGSPHAHEGELLAYTAYAIAYPDNVLVLVDTYDTLSSGLHNFLTVALALHLCGWKAVGVRLDSGDLSYLSKECRSRFRKMAKELGETTSNGGSGNQNYKKEVDGKSEYDYFGDFTIVASNDLSEKTILSLNQQGHEINSFGVGTDLVTCKSQPALGCVYKLVELEGKPRIKLSEELGKVTLPGKKDAYRLFDKSGTPIFDLLTLSGGSEVPRIGHRLLCRHPFEETKRAYVTPSHVQPLLQLVWDHGKVVGSLSSLMEIKANVTKQLQTARPDHLRPLNPTPYKVSVTSELYSFLHNLWLQEAPVREID